MQQHLNVPPENHVKVLGGQGWVGLIDHLGTESTIVNAARVSFGKIKTEMDERDAELLALVDHHTCRLLRKNRVPYLHFAPARLSRKRIFPFPF